MRGRCNALFCPYLLATSYCPFLFTSIPVFNPSLNPSPKLQGGTSVARGVLVAKARVLPFRGDSAPRDRLKLCSLPFPDASGKGPGDGVGIAPHPPNAANAARRACASDLQGRWRWAPTAPRLHHKSECGLDKPRGIDHRQIMRQAAPVIAAVVGDVKVARCGAKYQSIAAHIHSMAKDQIVGILLGQAIA